MPEWVQLELDFGMPVEIESVFDLRTRVFLNIDPEV